MNQPNLSVMAPKAAPVAESPDILALVRRYIWLLIAGAAVGAGASAGYYEYALNNQAEFTARIPFQVLPPPTPLGNQDNSQIVNMTQDDTSALINRQKLIFEQDPFLEKILNSDEFHPNGGDTQWLAQHKSDKFYYIKRDLVVVPRVNAGAFELTFTSRDPGEAQKLVQAAAKEYFQYLRTDSKQISSAYLRNLQEGLKQQETDYQRQSDALVDTQKSMKIDVLKAGFEIQKNALQSLNDDFTKADAAAQSAKGQYETFKTRRDNLRASGNATTAVPTVSFDASTTRPAGMSEVEIADLILSLEMKQYIENDFTLRTLINTRYQWEQQLAAEKSKPAPSGTTLKEIKARLDEIETQTSIVRDKLKIDALQRMAKTLEDESTSKRALADYIGTIRSAKEQEVNDLGQRLLQWDQRVADLKSLQELVTRMRNQVKLAVANSFTDDTRVKQMIDAPAVPVNPSWPKWYMFIPLGTMAGLGLSALIAYLLLLADTRIRTPRDISRTLQLPTLGFVPDEVDDRILTGDVETAILNSPSSMVAESFRQIRSHITAQTAHNPVNSLVVASVAPGGGATTVASNLAAAMALNDLRVLLVDANFYRPSLHRTYKSLPAEGLTDVLCDPALVNEAIMPHPELSRLHVMGIGGKIQGASSELFEGKAFRELLESLKSKYDLIIFDGAPLNLVSDSLSLASRVDGVVSVVRAGEVSRGTVVRIRDQIRGVHGNLLGFILNAAKTSNSGYFKENYRSFHRYAVKNGR